MNSQGAAVAGRLAAIASLAAREALRSRTMLIAVVLNVLYLLLLVLVGYVLWSSGGAEMAAGLDAEARTALVRVLLFFGVGGASTLALFAGVFASVGAIGGEIERGTILALAARPVARWEILVGKFLGNAGLAVAYLVGQGLAIGLVVALLTGIWVNDLLVALALLSLNVLVMVAVAVAGSTRLSTVANAVLVVVLFLGLTNTALLYYLGEIVDSDLLRGTADWARLILPVGVVSDLAGQTILAAGSSGLLGGTGGARTILPTHGWVWLYSIGYLGAVLLAGVVSLARRDLR